MMRDQVITLSRAQRAGFIVFVGAIVATTVLVVMGIAGVPWPKWLLALTTIF